MSKRLARVGIRGREDWRGRGIGSRLVETALRFCHDKQYLKITLDTYMEREPAVRLFEIGDVFALPREPIAGAQEDRELPEEWELVGLLLADFDDGAALDDAGARIAADEGIAAKMLAVKLVTPIHGRGETPFIFFQFRSILFNL